MNFDTLLEELQYRGLYHESVDGVSDALRNPLSAYIGFDPTAISLHIGSLIQLNILVHLRTYGHTAYALVGGATGMIGDPSGRVKERSVLEDEVLNSYFDAISNQISRITNVEVVNNYDWISKLSFIDMARDIGKHITVNYMLSKDSVKNRLADGGMTFTEFTYQMIQGYDFLHLNRAHGVTLQIGGSDQWGNMTTGMELLRRIDKKKTYSITTPLITKADGTKFGKSEGGNVWLDANLTTPFAFYQFWLNVSDDDAERFIKMFTFLPPSVIEPLILEHRENPSSRLLQKTLAFEVTKFVHSEALANKAVVMSEFLFKPYSKESIESLGEEDFRTVFADVEVKTIGADILAQGIVGLLVTIGICTSNREARELLVGNAFSLNGVKFNRDLTVDDLLFEKFFLLKRGKNKFYLLTYIP